MIVARLTPDRAAAALGALNFCWGIGAATWPVIVARFNPVPGVRAALLVFGPARRRPHGWRPPAFRCTSCASHRRGASHVVVGTADDLRAVHRDLLGCGIGLRRVDRGVHAAAQGRRVEHAMGDGSVRVLGGLAGGRGLVAVGLARRFESLAVFSGLVLVGGAIALLLAVSGSSPVFIVAVACGLGLSPSFPVTMAALRGRCRRKWHSR